MKYPELLVLEITQDDLDHGERFSPCRCPAARVAARVLKSGDVLVGYGGVDLAKHRAFLPWKVVRYGGTPELTRFLLTYDGGKPVQPTTLMLRKKRL